MATPYAELKDKYGNNLYFGKFRDIYIPAFPAIQDFRQHEANIRDLDLKPSDVIITGYPKTGTHWNTEIINMLIDGKVDYHHTEYESFIDAFPMPKGSNPPDSKPRALFTHLKFHHLPKQVFEKKVKLVYLARNLKDTWVSYYNHINGFKGTVSYDGTWSQFFDLMMSFGYWYGDWFDYVQDWERVIETQSEVPIFTNAYEDLQKDPVGQIEKLDKFLGYNRGRELCEQIADACSFAKLKKAKDDAFPKEFRDKFFKENAAGFYRKGQVGDWKNWFTVAQNEQFDEVYKKRMANSKLTYTFVL